jgi:hypothetical protein
MALQEFSSGAVFVSAARVPAEVVPDNVDLIGQSDHGYLHPANHQRPGAGQHVCLVALGYTMVYGV